MRMFIIAVSFMTLEALHLRLSFPEGIAGIFFSVLMSVGIIVSIVQDLAELSR